MKKTYNKADNPLSKSGKKQILNIRMYGKTLIFVLAGSIMIAHGARMIYQGLFFPNTYYIPGTFDIFFDWTTLIIFGILVLYFSFKTYLKRISEISYYQSDRKHLN